MENEIYGCFKYIGIPIETVKRMPIHERRFFIMKHNEEQEGFKNRMNKQKGIHTITGDALNSFAKLEQTKAKNIGGFGI